MHHQAKVELSETIRQIFAARLDMPQFGLLDDFFNAGGASIGAAMAVVELRRAGHTIAVADIFKGRTPQAIAERVVDGADSGSAE